MKNERIDIFESMKNAAEKRMDEMFVDSDHYMCSCGSITPNSEMNFPSPNPYSEPVCNECFRLWAAERTRGIK